MKILRVLMLVFLLPAQIFAQIVISEVMYQFPGRAQSNMDWVEIYNSGDNSVDISILKILDKRASKTGHSVKVARGQNILLPKSYAIVSGDTNPDLSVFDSLGYSLSSCQIATSSNFYITGSDTEISLKNDSSVDVVNFTPNLENFGAYGDGNSLQKIGNEWKSATPTPCAANSSQTTATTTDTTTATTTAQTATTTESQSINENKSVSSNWPIEPQVFAKITTGPNIGIVGADILFKGLGLGVSKKPLASARYYWNFGDGSVKEGEAVTHAYNFIGEYIVSLDVSSGYFSGNDRLKIKIIPADLKIVSVKEGTDGYVKIRNGNSEELDLSYWQISSGNQNFILPRNTFILPKNELTFSYLVTGISALSGDTKLLYPNGQVANIFDISSLSNPETISQKNTLENQISAVIGAVESGEKEAIYNSQKTTNLYDEGDKKGSILPWIAGVAALSILSSFVVVFGKKKEKVEEMKPGDDFEIID